MSYTNDCFLEVFVNNAVGTALIKEGSNCEIIEHNVQWQPSEVFC